MLRVGCFFVCIHLSDKSDERQSSGVALKKGNLGYVLGMCLEI